MPLRGQLLAEASVNRKQQNSGSSRSSVCWGEGDKEEAIQIICAEGDMLGSAMSLGAGETGRRRGERSGQGHSWKGGVQ